MRSGMQGKSHGHRADACVPIRYSKANEQKGQEMTTKEKASVAIRDVYEDSNMGVSQIIMALGELMDEIETFIDLLPNEKDDEDFT